MTIDEKLAAFAKEIRPHLSRHVPYAFELQGLSVTQDTLDVFRANVMAIWNGDIESIPLTLHKAALLTKKELRAKP